jgi:hypothetical protein
VCPQGAGEVAGLAQGNSLILLAVEDEYRRTDAAQVFGPAGLRRVRIPIGWLETALIGLPDGRPCVRR